MSTAKDNSVVYKRAQREVQAVAEAPLDIQERTKDDFERTASKHEEECNR